MLCPDHLFVKRDLCRIPLRTPLPRDVRCGLLLRNPLPTTYLKTRSLVIIPVRNIYRNVDVQ